MSRVRQTERIPPTDVAGEPCGRQSARIGVSGEQTEIVAEYACASELQAPTT